MKYLFVFLVAVFVLPLIVNSQEITPGDIVSARKIRVAELNDPIRPCMASDNCRRHRNPFDPNGAIFKDGIYHLWYLYQAECRPSLAAPFKY